MISLVFLEPRHRVVCPDVNIISLVVVDPLCRRPTMMICDRRNDNVDNQQQLYLIIRHIYLMVVIVLMDQKMIHVMLGTCVCKEKEKIFYINYYLELLSIDYIYTNILQLEFWVNIHSWRVAMGMKRRCGMSFGRCGASVGLHNS